MRNATRAIEAAAADLEHAVDAMTTSVSLLRVMSQSCRGAGNGGDNNGAAAAAASSSSSSGAPWAWTLDGDDDFDMLINEHTLLSIAN